MSELKGLIFDIRKFSLHDGPGIRTTVFFKGCPLSCWWCHNPESQSAAQELMLWDSRCTRCGNCLPSCPLAAIDRLDNHILTDRQTCIVCASCMDACVSDARQVIGVRMTVEAVMHEVERERPFYEESGGGVTFSGGEPMAQRTFLAALLRRSKEFDIHTALDTSGYTPWKFLDGLRGDVDLFLYDLKVMDEKRHRQITGVGNSLILQNLRKLSELGHRIIVRVPVIPGVNDDPDNLAEVAAFTASLPNLERIDLLPFHPSAAGKYERLDKVNRLPDVIAPSGKHMAEIAHTLEKQNLTVQVGG